VDHSIVWKIAQVNVPVLLAEVAAMMEQDKGERESS